MRWYELATGWWLLYKDGVELPVATVVVKDPAGLKSPTCDKCHVLCEQQARDEGKYRCPECDEVFGSEILFSIAIEVRGERLAISGHEMRWTVREATHLVMEHIRRVERGG